MKTLNISAVLLLLTLSAATTFGSMYHFPIAELMDPQFTTEPWGSGTLDGRVLLAGGTVRFNITLGTEADGGKTVIGDDWAISPSAGLEWDGGYLPNDPDEPHASPHDNVSIYGWDGIRLPVYYEAGTGPITMKVFMNTGMTGPSGYPSNDYRNNTGWTGVPQTLTVGSYANLVLDFSYAQVWGAADNPYPHSGAGESWADGTWQAINERDLREVTNFGFEIYGSGLSQVTLSIPRIPEPATGIMLCLAVAAVLMRRMRF